MAEGCYGKQVNISSHAVFTRDTSMTEVYSLWFWAFGRSLNVGLNQVWLRARGMITGADSTLRVEAKSRNFSRNVWRNCGELRQRFTKRRYLPSLFLRTGLNYRCSAATFWEIGEDTAGELMNWASKKSRLNIRSSDRPSTSLRPWKNPNFSLPKPVSSGFASEVRIIVGDSQYRER